MEFAIPNYTKTDCLFQSLFKSALFTNVIKKSKNTSIMKIMKFPSFITLHLTNPSLNKITAFCTMGLI